MDKAIADIQAKYEKRIRKLEGKFGELNAKANKSPAPVKKDLSEVISEGKNFKEMSEEFSEFTDTMTEQAKSTQGYFDDKLAEMREDMANKMISRSHRSWKETVKTDEFTTWFKGQDNFEDLNNSEDPLDVLDVLDNYKTFADNEAIITANAAKTKKASNRRLESNIPATSSSTNTPRQSEDDEEAAFIRAFKG